MIRWKCRQCGEGLEAPESLAGDRLACTRCGLDQRVGGGVIQDVTRVVDQLHRSTDAEMASLIAAETQVRRDRVRHRPALRTAVAQIGLGLSVYIVCSVLLGFLLFSVEYLDADDPRLRSVSIAAAVMSIFWLLGLAWFIGGVIRALFAASKML